MWLKNSILSYTHTFLCLILQVSLPSHLESNTSSATPAGSSLLQSPLMHPALRRIAGVYGNSSRLHGSSSSSSAIGGAASPTGPSAADRFSSPMPGSAKRRLFSGPESSNENATGTAGMNASGSGGAAPPKVMQVIGQGFCTAARNGTCPKIL